MNDFYFLFLKKKHSVSKTNCIDFGIRVIMITGDRASVAEAVKVFKFYRLNVCVFFNKPKKPKKIYINRMQLD